MPVDARAAMISGPWVLIVLYFFLTVAEYLFISPLGLSFVSKVAPKHLQGSLPGPLARRYGRGQPHAVGRPAHVQQVPHLAVLERLPACLPHLDGHHARHGEVAGARDEVIPSFPLPKRTENEFSSISSPTSGCLWSFFGHSGRSRSRSRGISAVVSLGIRADYPTNVPPGRDVSTTGLALPALDMTE